MFGSAEVSMGGVTAETETVDSIAADASQQMAADRPKLLAAEFSRNVARGIAANAADNKSQGLGILVSLLATVADQADVRIWSLLPDNIQVARLRLAPGTYDLTVDLGRGAGGGPARVLKDVSIEPGRMTFSSMQWASFH
jgi:hypothetical protein